MIIRELILKLVDCLIEADNFISKKEFYNQALEDIIISNEDQMVENLREAIDHQIIKETKSAKGVPGYTMPFDINMLKKFSDKLKGK